MYLSPQEKIDRSPLRFSAVRKRLHRKIRKLQPQLTKVIAKLDREIKRLNEMSA